MRLVNGAAVLALMVAGVVPAWAQDQTPQDRIDAAIAKAKAAGIPVELLNNKIAEGKAKGVSMDRLAAVIERREATLERARTAMANKGNTSAQSPTGADLSVGADAIESGVSEAVLAKIASTAPADRRTVAIAALTQLVQQGTVPQAALDRVTEAIKRGPEALANLPAAAGGRGSAPTSVPGAATGRGSAPSSAPPASVPPPGRAPEAGKPAAPGQQPTSPAGSTPTKPTTPTPPTPPGGRQ
jgi:hypothetical protein